MSLVVSRTTEIIAAEINKIKGDTVRYVLYNSIEIGRRLTEAKEITPHGEWGKFLESVNYNKSTANNLMKIFEEYGADQLTLLGDNAKCEAFGNLTYTKAIKLLAIPADEREDFIIENNVEDMSTRELDKVIKELNSTKEKLNEFEEKNKKLNEKLKKEKQNSIDILAKANESKEELEKRLGSIEEEKQYLENEKAKYEDKIRELKNRPIEVVSGEDEIAELKAKKEELENKIAQAAEEDKVTRYSIQFDTIVNTYDGLLETLDQMNPGNKEKFMRATKEILQQMLESL